MILLIYRLVPMFINKCQNGSFFDRNTSNWVSKRGKFKKENLKVLAGNFLPNLIGLVVLAWAFKFAALADMNQGIIATLGTLSGVYTMVWFYFKFSEIISFAQMAGMLLMFASVVLLALEGMSAGKQAAQVTALQ